VVDQLLQKRKYVFKYSSIFKVYNYDL